MGLDFLRSRIRRGKGIGLFACAAILGGCSPGMFFGSGTDDGVSNLPYYRQINQACTGLSLGQDTIDVPLFRKIVHCMNAYGAIDPVERMITRMSDTELFPLVDSGNVYLLKNRTRIYEFRQTFDMLKQKKILDETFRDVSRITENSAFVVASMALMRNSYNSPNRQPILRALEILSTRINPSDTADLLDVLLTLGSAKSYKSLMGKFGTESIYHRTLSELTRRVHSFVSDNRDPQRFDLGKELILAVIDGDGNLFRALDEVMGVDEASFVTTVPRASSMMKVTMKSEIGGDGSVKSAPLLDDVTSLFHYLNRPLFCLKGSKYIPNAAMWVIRELSAQNTADAPEYVKRQQLLTAVAMNPFCEYPPQLGEYYPSMIRLADTSGFEPSVDFIKAFFRNDLANLIVRMLADTGSVYPGGPPENTVRMKTLLPVVAELTDREIWDDLLLVASLPRVDSRDRLVRELKFIMQARAELDGRSIYDVLTSAVTDASFADFFRFARSFSTFVESGQPDVLEPSVTGLRRAFYVNDAHPLLNYLKDVTGDGRKNEALFDTLFTMTTLPEFEETISLISTMAKDGRLKDLVSTTLVIFSGFGNQSVTPIRATEEPAYVPTSWRRHNLDMQALRISPIVELPWDHRDPCRKLDTRIPMDEYNGPGFEEQLTNYVDCINRNNSHSDVATAVNFLRNERTSDGRTFFNLQIDIMNQLTLAKEEIGDLADRWIRAVDDVRFYRLMDALPFVVTHKFPSLDGVEGPVLRPLLDLLRPFGQMSILTAYRRLSDFGATVLTREEVPELLTYSEKIWDRKPEPQPHPMQGGFDFDRLAREVRNRECRTRPDDVALAVNRIIDDYNESITTWDLPEGETRRSWTKDEFKANLEPLFQKFGDPEQNRPEKHVIEGMLNTVRLFTLEPGEPSTPDRRYTPEALAGFLHKRSNDYRTILYFYPGETKPRVRLVNSLDRLELVVIDADLEFLVPNNFGLKFLAILGEAYGDDPFDTWPREIQKKYPRSGRKKPNTMFQAYKKMREQHELFKKLIGYPEYNDCLWSASPPYDPANPHDRRYTTSIAIPAVSGVNGNLIPLSVRAAIFNIGQTLPIIRENLPGPHGDPGSAGGLRVIRDLLWELHSSSPDRNQKDTAGWRNNLTVAVKLSRMGFFRQISRTIRHLDADDPTMLQFFRSFIQGAETDGISSIFHSLFVKNRDHQLAWRIMDGVSDVGEDPKKAAYMRQFVLSLVAVSGYQPLGLPKERGLIPPFLNTVDAVLKVHYASLARNASLVQDLLSAPRAAWLARALWEDDDQDSKRQFAVLARDAVDDPSRGVDLVSILTAMEADPVSHASWKVFKKRLDGMQESAAYKNLNLSAILRDILHFFEERPAVQQPETALRVREFMAKLLTSKGNGRAPGDAEEMILLMSRKPDDFYQVLETYSHYTENGELKEFIKLARRSLSEPPH